MAKAAKSKAKAKARPKPLADSPNWPASEIEMIAIDELIPYARNARTHSDTQVDQIAASMREWGWTIPVLIDEKRGLLAGHGRILAGKKNGYSHAPCMTARGWSEAKKKAYILADNKLALNAGWDNEILKLELDELAGMDFDMGLIGFSDDELDVLRNGWESDIDPSEHDGENLDGIKSSIKVLVDADIEERATEVIKKALGKAGIDFELP